MGKYALYIIHDCIIYLDYLIKFYKVDAVISMLEKRKYSCQRFRLHVQFLATGGCCNWGLNSGYLILTYLFLTLHLQRASWEHNRKEFLKAGLSFIITCSESAAKSCFCHLDGTVKN